MIIEAEYEEVDEAEGELDLSADDSLPWLEAEEDDYAAGALDTTQVVAFVSILVVALLLVVGSVWYFGGRTGGEVVADGSLIKAPEGPLKERPENPGGKEFDGTGNVAPVVGEGGMREGVIATANDAARNGDAQPDAVAVSANPPASDNSPASASQAAPIPAVSEGVGVQLAAYRTRARAQQGWNEINRRTNVLSGVNYRIEEGVVDIGTVYRLQAVATDRAAADRLCAALKDDGVDCQVKR